MAQQQAQAQENMDSLNLANDNEIKLLLKTEGDADEKVIFSENITKLNRKGKKQDRTVIITQKAIYNLKPKKFEKSKRRIPVRKVGMLTLSAISPEFAIHVPSEYDYHFASGKKDKIAALLKDLYLKETNGKLLVVYSELQHLKDIILTKKLAKFENKNSKNAMHETIKSTKDVLEEIDAQEMFSDDTDDDDDDDVNANYTDEDEVNDDDQKNE